MLLIPDLKTFAAEFMAERPNIENYELVSSDDEFGQLYKDVINTGNNCTMVVLIPTHSPNIKSEDNAKMKNNLTFMIVKKTDSKAGNAAQNDVFALCQLEVLALVKKIIALHHNFGINCIFRDIDLNSPNIVPVRDYFKANGYMLDISTNTNL